MNIKSEEMTNFTIKIDKKTREDYDIGTVYLCSVITDVT